LGNSANLQPYHFMTLVIFSSVGRDKGGGKTRGGGGSIKITTTKERKTKELDEKIIHLRKAVFAENGKDKDITVGIAPAFLKFDRNGLNVDISFSARLTEDEEDWAFDIVKSNMEEVRSPAFISATDTIDQKNPSAHHISTINFYPIDL
jgi:hypothetical protein